MLLGDQVYLDLPTLENFPNDPQRLADRFGTAYKRNGFGDEDYAEVLSAAPSVAMRREPRAGRSGGNRVAGRGAAAGALPRLRIVGARVGEPVRPGVFGHNGATAGTRLIVVHLGRA